MPKNYKWFKRITISILLLLIIGIASIVYFSPYTNYPGFEGKVVKYTVEIDASVDSVYSFLGNSKNASKWSVFVDHITPINADSFADGKQGSRRRCFCKADETGTQWDELISIDEPGLRRQLTIYNLKGFPMTADNLATEQIYEGINYTGCKLTFIVFFKDVKPSWIDQFKLHLAAYKITPIFKGNMNNIKSILEGRR